MNTFRTMLSRSGQTLARTFVFAAMVLSMTLPFAGDSALAHGYQGDPFVLATVLSQASRYGSPEGCAIVGGWEDGSIVAYCQPDTFMAHGPEAEDGWQSYDGPRLAIWLDRIACLDGQVTEYDCGSDPLLIVLYGSHPYAMARR